MLDRKTTFDRLNLFYESCLKFWNKEVTEELIKEGYTPNKLAFMDVQKLKHDPYSPNGKHLDIEAKVDWIMLHI